MSLLYSDLPLTQYPNSIDSFTQWLNIVATDGPLISQYLAAMNAGNQALATQILAQIPSGTQKILSSTDFNKLSQAILAVERFYKTDIEPYVDNLQTEWQNIINQFSYKGVWSNGTAYDKNNIVSYNISGLTLLYIATSNPPVGTQPNNTTYWRVLTIQGQQGPSGTGLAYRQTWNSGTQYQVNQAVTFDGSIWMSLQPSQNVQPGTNVSYWREIVSLEAISYPIQDTEPTNQDPGSLWFNTGGSLQNYYELDPAANAPEPRYMGEGYEAYDGEGNLIVGSMPLLTAISVITPPTTTKYLVDDIFDATGMVVTATYSNGSSKQVVPSVNPSGPLTQGVTSVTLTYEETGNTVTTTQPITVYEVSTTLNDNSWEVIRMVANRGIGENYWSVGDAKQITLNGTVGTKTYSNYQPWVFILGFNHNASIEGENTIHFGCFKRTVDDDKGVGLDDQFYALGTGTSNPLAFHMQNTDTNTGGWESTVMRNTILGSAASSPSSAPANSLLSIFPSDLKSVMKSCIKYTDNSGGNDLAPSSVTPTEEWLWLLSVCEVEGNTQDSTYNNSEQTVQKQYQYYADGNSTIKFRESVSSVGYWWLRSPSPKNSIPSHDYCMISGSGGLISATASTSRMLAPAFCV